MPWSLLPHTAAWRHSEPRDGLESVTISRSGDGWLAVGSTTAVEKMTAWWIAYEITLDGDGNTRSARIDGCVGGRTSHRDLTCDDGRWLVDGSYASELDGCVDVDLESSALTNAFPLRRQPTTPDQEFEAPAAFVRVAGLSVRRLEQHFRPGGDAPGLTLDYAAPSFSFTSRIEYDQAGLVVHYPGIADRIA